VDGTVYQEPGESDFYFEVTIGAWVVSSMNAGGPSSLYDEVMAAAGPSGAADLLTVARATGSG
jgi:hypothetical protein